MGSPDGEPKERPISIPDRLAYTRMILVPPIVALVLLHEHIDYAFTIAAILMAVASFSDWLDGYLARRWHQTSILGAFLDTVADKLLVAGTLFALVEVGRAWAWAAFIIVGREIAISGLRGIAAMDGVVVPPSIWGKIKASVQYLAILMALLRTAREYGGLYPDQWVLIVAVIVTVLSGVEYFSRFARVLRTDRARA
jgi:CDP-diacylglycerol--glycerol-3-phosphate 3-phosphatidyltransferase